MFLGSLLKLYARYIFEIGIEDGSWKGVCEKYRVLLGGGRRQLSSGEDMS